MMRWCAASLQVVNVSELAEVGEKLSFWQLVSRAQAVGKVRARRMHRGGKPSVIAGFFARRAA